MNTPAVHSTTKHDNQCMLCRAMKQPHLLSIMQAAHQVSLLPALVHRRGLHSCLHLKQCLMGLLELTRKVLIGP